MRRYYSPQGNIEIWDEGKQPAGYMTEDEWAELHPPVPYVLTKEEKLAALDAEYMAEKATLCEQYTDAQIHGDTETMESIGVEMTDLDDWYDTEYQKIINEEVD